MGSLSSGGLDDDVVADVVGDTLLVLLVLKLRLQHASLVVDAELFQQLLLLRLDLLPLGLREELNLCR